MLIVESEMIVDGVSGRGITDFLLDCDDDSYRAWWPGTHRQLHVLDRGGPDHVGDVVLMDEYVGSRHLRMTGEVEAAVAGERIVWRLRWRRIALPVRLALTLQQRGHGVHLRHRIVAGWTGPVRLLNPLWRLYFTRSFTGALDRHVHTEFPLLRDLLARERVTMP